MPLYTVVYQPSHQVQNISSPPKKLYTYQNTYSLILSPGQPLIYFLYLQSCLSETLHINGIIQYGPCDCLFSLIMKFLRLIQVVACNSTSFIVVDEQCSIISWRRNWQASPVFLPAEPHGQRSLAGYRPWGHRDLDTTERLTHTHTHTPLYGYTTLYLSILQFVGVYVVSTFYPSHMMLL